MMNLRPLSFVQLSSQAYRRDGGACRTNERTNERTNDLVFAVSHMGMYVPVVCIVSEPGFVGRLAVQRLLVCFVGWWMLWLEVA